MFLIKQMFGRLFPPPPPMPRVGVDARASTSDRAIVQIHGEIKHVQIAISDHAKGFLGMRVVSEGSACQTLYVYFDVADCDCEDKSRCQHSPAARVCDAITNRLKGVRLEYVEQEAEPSHPQ